MNTTEQIPPPESESQDLGIPLRNLPRNRSIMLRWLEGQSVTEIAGALDISDATVRGVLKRPEIQRELQRLVELDNTRTFEQRVADMAEEALDVARDTMRGRNISEMRWKAAKDLLDRHPSQRQRGPQESAGSGSLGDEIIKRLAQMQAETLGIVPKKEDEIDVTPQDSSSNADGPDRVGVHDSGE